MITKRIATIGLSLAFVLGAAAPAGAVTIAELQAQINALMAQLAALQGGTTGGGVTSAISSDLTIGSSGNSVVVLQQALVAQGYLTMPAGVPMGYFGSLTRAAVMRWQAANGVPSTGYFGPLSRAKFNASAGGTVPGTTVGGTGGVITTPGVEGTITVTKNPSPASGTKVYEGASKVQVLGIKLEAKTSDMKIERIKLDLDETGGTATSDNEFYRKFAQKVYVMDGSTVLASIDLNASTVVEESNEISITLAGMGYVVPKDTTKVLTIALDARSSWDSTYDADSWTVGVPVDGVRAVDGAGVNQYGPSTGNTFLNSVTSEGELAESATLTVSTNANTPADKEVMCTSGTDEDECDGLELLKVDFKAEKDSIVLTDLVVDVNMTGADTATATTAYIYDGSTLVGSATLAGLVGTNEATFSDIDWSIPNGTTKTLTVKIDVQDGQYAANTFAADIDTGDVTAENAAGTAITESGSATGESITIRKAGLEFTLLSKNVTYTPAASIAGATSSAKADFSLRLTARGSAVEFGDTGSTTYALADQDSTLQADDSFIIYRGGTATNPDVSSSTAMTIGTGVTAAGDANSWILPEGNSVVVDLSYVMETRDDDAFTLITSGAYQFGLERLNWLTLLGARQTSTFMSGSSAWRTGTVTLP